MADEDQTQDGDPLEPYRRAVRAHGSGFEATLWASQRMQKARFDVLIELVGAAALQGAVLLDLGCGDGSLAMHLKERGITVARYIGIDGVFEQVQAAQARELEDASFVCADLLDAPESLGRFNGDFAIISGTLNTMPQPVAIDLVSQVFACVNSAVAFNFLSNRPEQERRDAPVAPAVRHDVLAWLDAALDLTPLVAFRQDHLAGHDGAMLLRKET